MSTGDPAFADEDDPLVQVVMDDPVVVLPAALLTACELTPAARILATLHYLHDRQPTDADMEEAFGVPAHRLHDVVEELENWHRYEEYL